MTGWSSAPAGNERVAADIAPGGLSLPHGLHVSFQRYARRGDVIAQAPSSLGVLPVARAPSGELALPVARDEAFWIGLEMTQAGVRAEVAVRFELSGEAALDALSGAPWSEQQPTWIEVSPHASIEGIAVPAGGYRPFARSRNADEDGRALLDLLTRADAGGSERTRVLLVAYARFEAMTGGARPAPLDPEAQYRGWRLP